MSPKYILTSFRYQTATVTARSQADRCVFSIVAIGKFSTHKFLNFFMDTARQRWYPCIVPLTTTKWSCPHFWVCFVVKILKEANPPRRQVVRGTFIEVKRPLWRIVRARPKRTGQQSSALVSRRKVELLLGKEPKWRGQLRDTFSDGAAYHAVLPQSQFDAPVQSRSDSRWNWLRTFTILSNCF